MSGGIAYIFDEEGDFIDKRCNHEMVDFDPIEEDDQEDLKKWITKHRNYTGSSVAERILNNWQESLSKFVKVMPVDYKKARESWEKDPQGLPPRIEIRTQNCDFRFYPVHRQYIQIVN